MSCERYARCASLVRRAAHHAQFRSTLRDNSTPIPTNDQGAADAHVIQSVNESVLVDYHEFSLRPLNSPKVSGGPNPGELLSTGGGEAVFLSGGNHHYAQIQLELWSARPPTDGRAAWEISKGGMLAPDVQTLVFEGSGGRIGSARVQLPTAGMYGIRAYCRGRAAAENAEIGDDLQYPTNLEYWLIQLWVP